MRIGGVSLLLSFVALTNGQTREGFENGVNVVLEDGNAARNCLSLMEDRKNLNLQATCSGTDPRQVWYYYTDGKLGTREEYMSSFSDNGGAVQAFTDKSSKFSFLSGGRIRNDENSKCLASGYFLNDPPVQFLKYVDCAQAPSWKLVAASMRIDATPQVQQSQPTIVQSNPVVVQSSPSITQQTPSVQTAPAAPQVISVSASSGSSTTSTSSSTPVVQSAKSSVIQQGTNRAGMPSESDHYLCVCILSKDDDACIDAVKAACTVGHIPAEYCSESFEQGDHDHISRHIVDLIGRGAKCPSADMDKLRAEIAESSLPTHRFKGEQVVTAEDHYLCVCLSSGPDKVELDKQCEDAVRVACMVGHIPEADCFASFDEHNHGQVVEHILHLIDSGANCAQKLETTQSETCKNPPCYNSNKHSLKKKKVRKEPHYLCVCLEDRKSVVCQERIKQACKDGKIPKHDCDVALEADFQHAVTRHVMHLIDHGAECGVGGNGMLTFTNNRCHCKQEWTAPNGELLKFPDNCRDPGNQKGYSWCETYAEEGCIGVGDSMSWDRCDHPQHPRYHLGEFAQTSIGKITPVDHYLCVCVDVGASDEACESAVKAACQVGHLDSESCAKSFQNNDHALISDQILSMISHGARCNNIEIGFQKEVTSTSDVPYISIASECGHGTLGADGKCVCAPGFSGHRCDYCAEGYIGYPDCSIKQDCSPACMYGTCNFHTGTCSCPSNRKGSVCSECAFGYSGKDCSPSGLMSGGSATWFFLFMLAGGLYACCCTPFGTQVLQKMPWSTQDAGGAYSRLNQDVDYFDDDEGQVLEVEEAPAASGRELTGLSVNVPTATPTLVPPQSHTGLAI